MDWETFINCYWLKLGVFCERRDALLMVIETAVLVLLQQQLL